MMPVAMGIGTDPSFRAPMAIVVVGGLITSTFLSLLVIPVIYTFVDGLGVRLRKLLGRDATGLICMTPPLAMATVWAWTRPNR